MVIWGMHALVRRYLFAAVTFLILGLVLGLVMLWNREIQMRWPHPYLVSAHAHLLFVGFVMFMILGVAQWIFPRPARGDDRYRPGLAGAVFWILLLGTVGRTVGETARAGSDAAILRYLVLAAGSAQAIGLMLFFWNMRSRIRPAGSQLRESRGERF